MTNISDEIQEPFIHHQQQQPAAAGNKERIINFSVFSACLLLVLKYIQEPNDNGVAEEKTRRKLIL